jgi:hypothetical protein
VAGDDLLVATYRPYDFAAVKCIESQFGIRPDARAFTSPEDVSFTSGVFVLAGPRYSFIPKPGRLLAKLWWTVGDVAPRDYAAYRRGVSLGLLPTNKDVPVVRAFLYPYSGPGRVITSSRGFKYHGVEVSGNFWPWFLRRYHTTRRDVDRLEAIVHSLAHQCVLLVDPLMEHIVEVDVGGLESRELVEHA